MSAIGSVRWRIALLETPAVALIGLTAWWALSVQPPGVPDPLAALSTAITWLVVPGLCLIAGLMVTASMRFTDSKAIDGRSQDVPASLEVLLRYNRNTLEQVVLVALAWPALAMAVPEHIARLAPALAGLFALGRLTFLLGYLYAPWARGFGFALTFYPTALVYGWLVKLAVT